MAQTRRNPDGSITEVPPLTLDCGHPVGPGLVIIGHGPHPAGGRARSYYCRTCRETTYGEPDRR